MMKRVGKLMLGVVVGIIAIVALVLVLGPRQQFDLKAANWPDQAEIEQDSVAYLAQQEAKYSDVKPNQHKQILWAGKVGEKTDIAIVYVHGFSASPQEIRPVPDNVGAMLSANVYFTRLAGHGRPGDAMGDVHVNEWAQDLKEAVMMGQALGERVVMIGTSTGGTLVAAALKDMDVAEKIDGIVFISPNFAPQSKAAFLARLPLFNVWGPMLAGKTRSWQAGSAAQEEYWNTSYPTQSVVPMMRLIASVDKIDFGATDIPALFYFSDKDQVVRADVTRGVVESWGGAVEVVNPLLTEADDKDFHVIAGDIESPNQTAPASAVISEWIGKL